jgi:hypothetical protein
MKNFENISLLKCLKLAKKDGFVRTRCIDYQFDGTDSIDTMIAFETHFGDHKYKKYNYYPDNESIAGENEGYQLYK